ncbi:MAG: HAMP domain-containing histidine kinase [Flavobacteriales bacterium]|nr:HAMP domain-containing histidine kinase [Flavobacteriales bacterium]
MKLNIRAKLAVQFTIIVASILILFSLGVYYLSAEYRSSEFYTRIKDKALNTASLLLKVDEVSLNLLKVIDRNTVNALYDEQVLVFAGNDTLMYSSKDRDQFQVDNTLLHRIRKEKEVRFTSDEYEVMGMIYEYKDQEYVVVSSALDKYGRSKLNNLRWVLILGAIGSIILTIIASMIYAGRALKPMSKVVQEVDSITISNLNTRVDVGNGEDEIAQLAITFNKMLERLESAFFMQRSFVSNASHELRTPLTAITSQIEVTLMKQRTEEEYIQILTSVLEDIKNLNSLSNGLLDLAKINSDLSSFQFKLQRIDEMLWLVSSDLKKVHPNYHIDISFRQHINDESKLQVIGNEHLLRIALLNLVDNGCKYSSGHSVKVELALENEHILITIVDEGIGIKKSDLHRIFDPFYRAENVRHIRGHGLGLSLSERIITLHQGEFHIESEPGKGTKITLKMAIHNSNKISN